MTKEHSHEKMSSERGASESGIDSDSEEHTLLNNERYLANGTTQRYLPLISYCLNFVLICVVAVLYALGQRRDRDPSLSPSPAQKVISYDTVKFNDAFGNDTTPYQGIPTDETDALWEDLYDRGVGIKLSPQEFNPKDVSEDAEYIPVPGLEDYYLGGLDVFHQLHCLNMIRMSFYPERYNMTMYHSNGTLNYLQWLHMDHCVEILRQRLLCTADTTVVWYFWRNDKSMLTPRVGQPHTCRNFEAVREWAFERWVEEIPFSSRVVDGKIVDFGNDTASQI